MYILEEIFHCQEEIISQKFNSSLACTNTHLLVPIRTCLYQYAPFPPTAPSYEEMQLRNLNGKLGVSLNCLLGIKNATVRKSVSQHCDCSWWMERRTVQSHCEHSRSLWMDRHLTLTLKVCFSSLTRMNVRWSRSNNPIKLIDVSLSYHARTLHLHGCGNAG